jgi:hypothetical protein
MAAYSPSGTDEARDFQGNSAMRATGRRLNYLPMKDIAQKKLVLREEYDRV